MALDKLTLLINRVRRLEENNENGELDDKIDELREQISDLISDSGVTIKVKAFYEREVSASDFDSDNGWIIDEMVERKKSLEEILSDDVMNNARDYICWEDLCIVTEDSDGNEIDEY